MEFGIFSGHALANVFCFFAFGGYGLGIVERQVESNLAFFLRFDEGSLRATTTTLSAKYLLSFTACFLLIKSDSAVGNENSITLRLVFIHFYICKFFFNICLCFQAAAAAAAVDDD